MVEWILSHKITILGKLFAGYWKLGIHFIWKKFSSQAIPRSYTLPRHCPHCIRNGTSYLHDSLVNKFLVYIILNQFIHIAEYEISILQFGPFTFPSLQYQLALPEIIRTKCHSPDIYKSKEEVIEEFLINNNENNHILLFLFTFFDTTCQIFIKSCYSFQVLFHQPVGFRGDVVHKLKQKKQT